MNSYLKSRQFIFFPINLSHSVSLRFVNEIQNKMNRVGRIKIGVIGVGHLGNHHVKHLSDIPEANLIGIFDTDREKSNSISKKYNTETFDDLNTLIQSCEALSVVTPTQHHAGIAEECLRSKKHIFIEKPITSTLPEADNLLGLAEESGTIIQVGHIERFNPAFMALETSNLQPLFIETHRLAPFNPRGNDVPVILDLMIHDLDIVLSLVKSEIKDIRANGVKVVSSTVDIANARLEFENGCVANITASRISQKSMRKIRLFQEKDYITIDFQSGEVEEYKICSTPPDLSTGDQVVELAGAEKRYIHYHKPVITQHDALKEELIHFADSIIQGQQPEIDGHSAAEALKLALEIQKIIDS